MNDEDFLRSLDDYLAPPADVNPAMIGLEIIWERGDLRFGARHIWDKHGITEQEVEEVIFEVPPYVEARRHRDFPDRTVFWGATRGDRWIVIVCEDRMRGGARQLRPITAFEPDEGVEYWERNR